MTRSTLLRVALGCAGLLGCAVLGAGIHRLGIPSTLAVLTACVIAGAAASAGWHGIARLLERPEPPAPPGPRHRAPRPEAGIQQRPRPSAAEPPPAEGYTPPEEWPRGMTRTDAEEFRTELAERFDPYLTPHPGPHTQWPEAAPDAGAGEDLYAHPGQQAP